MKILDHAHAALCRTGDAPAIFRPKSNDQQRTKLACGLVRGLAGKMRKAARIKTKAMGDAVAAGGAQSGSGMSMGAGGDGGGGGGGARAADGFNSMMASGGMNSGGDADGLRSATSYSRSSAVQSGRNAMAL